MTEPDLALRRKRLFYQSGHRGTKELDLLLGCFAEQCLNELSPSELDDYEQLLDGVPEATLYDWLTGQMPVDPAFDTPVFRKIRATPFRV
jgi:antitoxin CptB